MSHGKAAVLQRISTKRIFKNRIGGWLPNDQKYIEKWLDDLIKEVEQKYSAEKNCTVKLDENFVVPNEWLHSPVREFKEFVDSDPALHMQYSKMFTEVTRSKTPTGSPQVKNYHVMFLLVDFIMLNWAPRYIDSGLVGFPINIILNWSMGTADGYAAFLNKEANDYWMKVLNEWGNFLKSKASCYVLNEKPWGWFGEDAQKAMSTGNLDFVEEFQCNPKEAHYGFTSWDNFFIRKFRDGVRPVASPDDLSIITSACESAPFDLQDNVQYQDEFWIKEQWYSLRHLLNEDEYTSQFVGGTIYQAFLSALNYHRWHSPVDGKVVKAYNIPGTYYSSTLNICIDDAAPDKSQGYICQVAARSVIFIEADNPAIGLMCFVAVGMSEVSTCEINPEIIPKHIDGGKKHRKPATYAHVKKGDEIGMFHFGGSTHCLIFRPGVKLEFDPKIVQGLRNEDPPNIKLNSKVATVCTK